METKSIISVIVMLLLFAVIVYQQFKFNSKVKKIKLSLKKLKEKQNKNQSPLAVGSEVKLKGFRNKHIVISDTIISGKPNEVKCEEILSGEVHTSTWKNIKKWEIQIRVDK